jgi:hypothetical protein
LSPVAIQHGYFTNTENPAEENINERVHWSVIAKRAAVSNPTYTPPNLPPFISPVRTEDITPEERTLLGAGDASA